MEEILASSKGRRSGVKTVTFRREEQSGGKGGAEGAKDSLGRFAEENRIGPSHSTYYVSETMLSTLFTQSDLFITHDALLLSHFTNEENEAWRS